MLKALKMVKAALIGYGYWGPNLLRNLSKHPCVEVKYVCDLYLNNLNKAKSDYPNITVTPDYKKIINNKEVTCVVIAVPTIKHFRISKEFILAGKNVLVEKPMTTTVQEAQELVRLAAEKKVILCVDHPYIFSEPIKKIKSLIDRNKLGRLYYYNSIRANLGRIDKSTNVFVDLAPHDLAMLDYLLDKKEPLEVYARGSSHILGKSIESGSIFLKYNDGFVANIHLSWLSPIKIRHITLAGSKKIIVNDDLSLEGKLQIFNTGIDISNQQIKYKKSKSIIPKMNNTEPLYEVIDSFVKAVLYNKTPLNDGALGLRVVKVLDRISGQIS